MARQILFLYRVLNLIHLFGIQTKYERPETNHTLHGSLKPRNEIKVIELHTRTSSKNSDQLLRCQRTVCMVMVRDSDYFVYVLIQYIVYRTVQQQFIGSDGKFE